MKQISILTLFLALCWGCTCDYDDTSSPEKSGFTVADARKYFEQSNTQVADLTFSATTRAGRSMMTPDWEGAKITGTGDVTTVETPLTDGESQEVTIRRITQSGVTTLHLSTFKRLVTQCNKQGDVRQFVVTMTSAGETRSAQQDNCYGKSDYSGFILISSVDGAYQDAFESEGGVWTRQRVAAQDTASEDGTLNLAPYSSGNDEPAPDGFIKCNCGAINPVESEYCGGCKQKIIGNVVIPGMAPECSECRQKVYECICCKDCKKLNCICKWMCPKCKSPYCQGCSTSGGGDSGDSGSSGGTTPTNPLATNIESTKNKLQNIISNNKLKDLIRTKIIPIKISTKTKIMSSDWNTHPVTLEISDEAISMNSNLYNRFTLQAQQLLFFHEYMHFYFAYDKKSSTNTDMWNSPEYSQGIREIYPGKDETFYYYMRWSGCTDTPEFFNQNDFEQVYIKSWLKLNLEQR